MNQELIKKYKELQKNIEKYENEKSELKKFLVNNFPISNFIGKYFKRTFIYHDNDYYYAYYFYVKSIKNNFLSLGNKIDIDFIDNKIDEVNFCINEKICLSDLLECQEITKEEYENTINEYMNKVKALPKGDD